MIAPNALFPGVCANAQTNRYASETLRAEQLRDPRGVRGAHLEPLVATVLAAARSDFRPPCFHRAQR